MKGIIEDPNAKLDDLEMISDEERLRILNDWNATARPYSRDESVAQVFEEQAASRPGAVAVVSGDERLTYGELNSRANRLARERLYPKPITTTIRFSVSS